ncbi:cbb3-type cytochrome c oxidase subunit 3 [uncultured Tateyamaria sp.]|uniref:cbb3-type cytochrome oxidase subunit 3 n=1 Tax=uncultured Tateyamaria sp. TaxID=455651 RepID=UPI002624D523|nr:cbb3-type cytochrome c oxidase subunit 3 [uncultured Tateyamaria sp.]
MEFDHNFFVGFAKSYGLFYMMAFFFGAVVYAYWPANQEKFDQAAKSILDEDEGAQK